eukprot:1067334-Karenia_brevis.AAC.1
MASKGVLAKPDDLHFVSKLHDISYLRECLIEALYSRCTHERRKCIGAVDFASCMGKKFD